MYLSWSIKIFINKWSKWSIHILRKVKILIKLIFLWLVLPRPNYVFRVVVFIFKTMVRLKPFLLTVIFCNLIIKMTSSKSPKNWSEWNNTKHFSDYSIDSGTGKFVRFTIAALLFVPVGFLTYMTTI